MQNKHEFLLYTKNVAWGLSITNLTLINCEHWYYESLKWAEKTFNMFKWRWNLCYIYYLLHFIPMMEVIYLRYDGWCICMGLSGRFLGSKESPHCHIDNERHLHSCLKFLSDVRTVHALQVSQRSCVSRPRMVDLPWDHICQKCCEFNSEWSELAISFCVSWKSYY